MLETMPNHTELMLEGLDRAIQHAPGVEDNTSLMAEQLEACAFEEMDAALDPYNYDTPKDDSQTGAFSTAGQGRRDQAGPSSLQVIDMISAEVVTTKTAKEYNRYVLLCRSNNSLC
jgi:hypothetical protein